MQLANTYTRVLRDSRATTMLYWEMMGQDYNINDGETPYPALLYFDQLQRHFPAGSQIVGTPDDATLTFTILSLAARTPQGGFSIEVLNQVKDQRRVVLTGLPNGPYTLTRLTETAGVEALESIEVTGSHLEMTLPGQSIYFFALASQ